MIRVCHITSNLGFGGAEIWVRNMCAYEKERKERSVVYTIIITGQDIGTLEEDEAFSEVEIIHIPFNWKNPVLFRKKLKKLLTESEITHLHNHQDWVSGWHWLAIIGLNVKKISHLHNPLLSIQNYTDNYSRPGRVAYYILGSIFQCFFSDDIFSTSAAVLKQYGLMKRLNPRLKPKVMYCGIPVVQLRSSRTKGNYTPGHTVGPSIPSSRYFLFVGRLTVSSGGIIMNQKNPIFAFKVASQLLAQHQDIEFHVCGRFDEVSASTCLEEVASKHRGRVKLLGVRSDVRNIMRNAEFLLFPSFEEGLGLVAVESQMEGTSVLASENVPQEAIISDTGMVRLPLDVALWTRKCNEKLAQNENNLKLNSDNPFEMGTSMRALKKGYMKCKV